MQFSLIDIRPLHGMADVCQKHGLKLLTYGTLVCYLMTISILMLIDSFSVAAFYQISGLGNQNQNCMLRLAKRLL